MLSTIVIGCKNEKSGDENKPGQEQPAVDEQFKVTLDMTVKKDDNFQVYYKNGDNAFTEEESMWVAVKGQDTPQQIVFSLPKDVVPDLIRIDLGMSDAQEDMTITGVHMDFYGKNFTTQGLNMANYFRPLEGTEVDFNTGIIKAVKKDGKRVEPVLYPHEIPLGEAISKIVK